MAGAWGVSLSDGVLRFVGVDTEAEQIELGVGPSLDSRGNKA